MSKVNRFSLEERYNYQIRKVIYDRDTDSDIELNNIYLIIDQLNKLDKQIADLEAKLAESEKEKDYYQDLYFISIKGQEKLKQQLHSQPAEIVGKIRSKCCVEDKCKDGSFVLGINEKDLDTILKEYQK